MASFSIRSVVSPTISRNGTRPTSSESCSADCGISCRPPSLPRRRPTSRMVKPKPPSSLCGTETAEISTGMLPPLGLRSVVENRRTLPRWRRLASRTLRSTPARPSQRSSDSPSANSARPSCTISAKARLTASISPSLFVTTKASGVCSSTRSTISARASPPVAWVTDVLPRRIRKNSPTSSCMTDTESEMRCPPILMEI